MRQVGYLPELYENKEKFWDLEILSHCKFPAVLAAV